MGYGSTAKFQAMKTLAFGSIGANYTVVDSPFDFQSRILIITNLTDESIIFSDDNVTDCFILMANSAAIFDMMSNSSPINTATFPKLLTIYAKDAGVAPTSGAVYVSSVYCKGD